jgi:diguanylate cyclase (GGDEF)-like protein
VLYDSSERIVVVNRPYIEMYGLSDKIVKPGCTLREVYVNRQASGTMWGKDPDEYLARVRRKAPVKRTEVVQTVDGRYIQINHEPLADGGWVATHDDITAQRRAELQVIHLVHYDALTDLPNLTLFRGRLTEELAQLAPARRIAVHYIDIDDFKSVNDSLGHAVGDELLKAVAASLNEWVNERGFVARLSADQFAVVQTGVASDAEVLGLVDDVFEAIRTPFDCHGHQLTIDASIGTALAPDHGSDVDQMLKNADLAMYAAKSAGGHTSRFFDPAVDDRTKARQRLAADLREAVSQGALQICYQPSVAFEDDRIMGCEALVHWRHPEQGVIPPAELISIAEESGLINQLGEWMLTRACAEAASWPGDVRLAIDISPEQFKSGTLALKIIAALGISGLPAERLELEIAEGALIRDEQAAQTVLRQLRDIGVRLTLECFGVGHSSLSHLQRFPFDKVKIDHSFIKDVDQPDGSASIVQAVASIAAARKMTAAAEGVETEAQRQLLGKLGCAEIQGPLLGGARPGAKMAELIVADRHDVKKQRSPRKSA